MVRIPQIKTMRVYRRHMTPEERLEAAKSVADNPCVESVKNGNIKLTKEFRDALYFAWRFRKSSSTIDRMLLENGLGWRTTGKEEKGKALHKSFRKRYEKEKIDPDEERRLEPEEEDRIRQEILEREKSKEDLVREGILKKRGRGYGLTDEFIDLAERSFPESTPYDVLYDMGIYPDDVGLNLLHRLEERLISSQEEQEDQVRENHTDDTGVADSEDMQTCEDAEDATKAETALEPLVKEPVTEETEPEVAAPDEESHRSEFKVFRCDRLPSEFNPYITKDDDGSEMIAEAFYNEAKPLIRYFDIDQILSAYMINTENQPWLDARKTGHDLKWWIRNGARMDNETMAMYLIRANRIRLMEDAADRYFKDLGEAFDKLLPEKRKEVCLWISRLPNYPSPKFSTKAIIGKCGISKSVYYRYVNDSQYGRKLTDRHVEDIRRIKIAFEYGGYRKGTRQVCMLIPRLFNGERMGYNKVCDLMKKSGLKCDIRKNRNLDTSFIDENKKPNILKRRFRLFRPNRVRVTDVTYLFHGAKSSKAYGSALMDPVTGRLIEFNVSENNDLPLVLETLKSMDRHPCEDGGIFHSDQGILYHTDDFQDVIKALGLNQSMSKKGNCWDNAVQESFFGHFKDECDYSACETIEELQKAVSDYKDYYNNLRGMWNRGRMTPVEYEEYLLSLDEDEWNAYLAKEEEAYQRMKEEAARKAIENARNLGMGEVEVVSHAG